MRVSSEKVEALLTRYQIQAVVKPSADWKRALRSQYFKTCKAIWRKFSRQFRYLKRSDGQPEIFQAYDDQWRKKCFSKYVPRPEVSGAPWVWGNKKWLMSNEAGAAIRLLYLDSVISFLKPRTVLEAGCGNGINLLLLSARYPNIHFVGLEPTRGGVDAAELVTRGGVLPDSLIKFAPFKIFDPCAPARLKIIHGNAKALPFDDRAFDLVFTSLALEQMEGIRHQALGEIARVSRRWVAMLEPFKEVNSNGWRRLYVQAFEYFQGSIADLSDYGLEVRKQIINMPHKSVLGTALVVTERVK
jgi:SAM-dependent methyltransferase